jgi:hypothetical protein
MARKQTPVDRMVEKFGGTTQFAEVCGVNPAAVRHWRGRKPNDKQGRDGRIPDRYHTRILAVAKKRGIKLNPAELVNT